MILSIIIVNYKTPELVIDCVRSLDIGDHQAIEVLVVDNNSEDESREQIMSVFPFVKWIQIAYNSGFARANNQGIVASTGEVVLLLNSDTLDIDHAVINTFQAFTRSNFAAAGVQLINADGTPQISGNFFMRGSLNNLLPLPYIGAVVRWLGMQLSIKKPHIPDAQAVQEVDWINGAFLMVKKSVIDRAGLLDEDFFLYAEEAEWCYRIGKFGKLAIFGQFRVKHLQGQTANSTFGSESKGYYNLYDRKGLQIALSNFVRIRKQFGAGWFLIHLLTYTVTIPVYFLANLIRLLMGKKDPYQGSVIGFTKTVVQLWSFSPTILRNKSYFYKVL